MYVVFYRIIVRKERIQGIHFIFPFFIAQGGGGQLLRNTDCTCIPQSPQFFYSLAGNVQNSSIKTMVNYFTAICPQCRKRLDKTDIDDSPGAQAAASSDKPKAAVDVCSSQLDEVRIRCDQHTHEVKA